MRAGHHDGRKRLYLDFDGYFAAVEEQAAPALHGRTGEWRSTTSRGCCGAGGAVGGCRGLSRWFRCASRRSWEGWCEGGVGSPGG